ncbi:MAG: sulfotransferase [Solimonas sp.]
MSQAPLFILAAPFSGASRLAATLGTHPQLCAIPETNLFVAGTVSELLEVFEIGQGSNADGLLRAIALLEFGAEDDEGIAQAGEWLAARAAWPTAEVLRHLMARAAPRRLVMPETESVLRPMDIARLRQDFPDASLLHLVRHPYTYGGLFAPWLHDRLFVATDFRDHAIELGPIDPQIAWLRVNRNIETLLQPAYDGRYLRIRDEQLLDERAGTLATLARFAGVGADRVTLDGMQAAGWPFHGYGPRSAPYGLDPELLEGLAPAYDEARLEGPLPWRADGKPLAAEIVALARQYGY